MRSYGYYTIYYDNTLALPFGPPQKKNITIITNVCIKS